METINFNVHYYLSDNSHSMEAYTRNRLEKYLLNAINEIAKENNIKVIIKSTTKKQGGLWDLFNIIITDQSITTHIKTGVILSELAIATKIIDNKGYLRQKIIDLLFDKFTKKGKLEIEGIELDNAKKREELNKLKAENNNKIDENISNFYLEASKCTNVSGIGYQINGDEQQINENEEVKVAGKDFSRFIKPKKKKNKETYKDDNAIIDIISPILKNHNRYKWRGIYNEEIIDFSMADKEFKENIKNAQYEFSSKSMINCLLEITELYDENEEIKGKTYKVIKVYEMLENSSSSSRKGQYKNYNKDKSNGNDQPDLFYDN